MYEKIKIKNYCQNKIIESCPKKSKIKISR